MRDDSTETLRHGAAGVVWAHPGRVVDSQLSASCAQSPDRTESTSADEGPCPVNMKQRSNRQDCSAPPSLPSPEGRITATPSVRSVTSLSQKKSVLTTFASNMPPAIAMLSRLSETERTTEREVL